jgi:hypothetical protein
MPCNASYARFIFGKFYTSTIILYVLLFAQKVLFFFCKKWVLQTTHPQTAQHRGLAHPRHNHNMEGECSGHDDVYPVDGSVVAKNQLPRRMAPRSSQRTVGTNSCSASAHRDGVSTMVKQAHRWPGRYCGSATHATLARAYAQNGKDPDGGHHNHSGLGQRVGPSSQSGEAQAETAAAKSLGASLPLTADEVDRMYCQLAEIHAKSLGTSPSLALGSLNQPFSSSGNLSAKD